MNNKLVRTSMALASAGVLAFGLTACMSSSNDDTMPTQTAEPDMSNGEMVSLDPLTGESTTLTFDSAFMDMLTEMNVTVSPVGTAAAGDMEGSVMFPITGGELSYETEGTVEEAEGTIMHDNSGFSITDGSTVIEVTNLEISLDEEEVTGDVSVNGETPDEDVMLFEVDGSEADMPVMADPETGMNMASLKGLQLMLSDDLIGVLQDSFSNEAISDDDDVLVGTVLINAMSEADESDSTSTDDSMTDVDEMMEDDDTMTETPMPSPSMSTETESMNK